jgi:23S rRNA (guanosine2251-2'-O)-methyltransferase
MARAMGEARPWSGLRPEDVLGPEEEIVAGRRPVEEAFAARRPAHRLLVVPERRAALDQLVLHATTLRIPVVEVEGGTITALSGFDGHQGVALVVEPRRWSSLDEVLALASSRSEPAFVLVLDHLEDPQNVGTLLRSAEAAGVHGVLFPRRGSAPLSPAAVKTSAGATEHLLLVPLDDLPAGLVDLHTRGVRIVGADGAASLTARELDLRGPLAVVIGSEGRGLDGRVRRRVDVLARIPMRGRIGSLNASVAGSIFLFEAAAQRGLPASAGPDTLLDADAAELGQVSAAERDEVDAGRSAEANAPSAATAGTGSSLESPDAAPGTGIPVEEALLPEAPPAEDAPGQG